MHQKYKASTGSREKQEPNKMVKDATARHYDWSIEICLRTTNVQETLYTFSDAVKL